MDIPIISDTTHALAKAYGVLKEDEGIAYRGLFIIDPKGLSHQQICQTHVHFTFKVSSDKLP